MPKTILDELILRTLAPMDTKVSFLDLCERMRHFLVIFKHCVTFLEVWVLTSLRLIINRLLEVCWSCFGTTYTTTLIFSSHCTLMLSLYWIWWITKKKFYPSQILTIFSSESGCCVTLTETTYWITAAAFQLLPDDTLFIRFIQFKISNFWSSLHLF